MSYAIATTGICGMQFGTSSLGAPDRQQSNSMQYLDLTLPAAAENLALDEALLEEAEASRQPVETLRLWESPQPMVVVGRSSRLDAEVNCEACRVMGVPVLRRISGGAAIVAGPGCLMYAVVLSYQQRPELRGLSEAHRYVLDTITTALQSITPGVRYRGTCDLVLDLEESGGGKKFSGNSVRCRREHFLYHGTLLYDFPLDTVGQYLTMPPRMPDYREHRSHDDFVANLPITADAIRQSLITGWNARELRTAWPRELVAKFVAEKYSRSEWNENGQVVTIQ